MQKDNYKKKDYKKDFNNRKDFSRKPFRKKLNRADFYLPGCPEGVRVPDPDKYTLEKALKYLKRQLKDSEKLLLVKERRYFEKPSSKRVKKMERARALQKRHDAMQRRTDKHYESWLVMTPRGAR